MECKCNGNNKEQSATYEEEGNQIRMTVAIRRRCLRKVRSETMRKRKRKMVRRL